MAKVYQANEIKNVAMLGGSGSGKTTLMESMLFECGVIKRRGSIEAQSTVCDYFPVEKEYGYSVFSTVCNLEFGGKKLNIIDCAGSDDFCGGTVTALHVVDTAAIVLTCNGGVEVGTQNNFRLAEKAKKPIVFVVNKCDHENANFDRTIETLKDNFGNKVCLVQYPVNAGAGFNAVIDVLKGKMLVWKAEGGAPELKDIPAEEAGKVEELLGALHEMAAEADEALMEKFFEKYIFNAIEVLYRNGALKIQPIDIENEMSHNEAAKATFKNNNGIEYLQDIQELAEIENFPYYYNKFKKLNLLSDLKKSGFDISSFYCEDLTNPKSQEINSKFEFLTLKDITDGIRSRILGLETKYEVNEEVETESAAEGIDELMESLRESQDIGMPVQGVIFNQIIDGARKGTLTIRSAASSVGKTRNAVADACYLAYPIRYNSEKCEWEQVGSSEKVLFIVTEQQFKEVRKMILAYLTDLNESRFKYGDFNEREQAVITQAIGLMKKYEDNLTLVKMPNPTIELVKTLVRENCITRDIGYVFYDYIFIGPALLNEFKGFNLRNDEVLLMFATALKDLAVELDVAMFTSTQLNAKGDDNKDIRNEGSLAGGRSTINKADNGAIMARPTKEELDVLEPLFKSADMPNLVTDIYKVRSGEWTQVRIWSVMNLGTLRKRDLFITNSRLEPIEEFFEREEYMIKNWDSEEDQNLKKIIERLENGEIVD